MLMLSMVYTYFRGIRPGLIEAMVVARQSPMEVGYFRGIRPGLIEAIDVGERIGTGGRRRISGASAPASLKHGDVGPQRGRASRISGASAPASLKLRA